MSEADSRFLLDDDAARAAARGSARRAHGRGLPRSRTVGVCRSAFTLAALSILSLAGCLRSARLDRRIEQIDAARLEAEALGALRCAPRELASAQSQLEFGRLEREQGDIERAVAHLDAADENVRAAQLLSAPERCGGSREGPATSTSPHSPAAPASRAAPVARTVGAGDLPDAKR
jgi:hypothetical protein